MSAQKRTPVKRELKKDRVAEHGLISGKLESISSKNSDNFKLPLKDIQKAIVNLHRENDIVILDGYAGTGKDFMQIYRAMSGLISKEFEEVIFMRTIVEATSSKIGFLPGSEDDKTLPYLEIFYAQMQSMLKPTVYARLKNKVRFEYPGFIRGKTFGGAHRGNVCIVLTEAQNCELRELVTISTRLSEGSKLFINGCTSQSDIGSRSGFKDFMNIVGDIEGIHVEKLGDEFQMRGRLVMEIDKAHRNFLNGKK
jgi:phosphate starvation-inducible protein PhoH